MADGAAPRQVLASASYALRTTPRSAYWVLETGAPWRGDLQDVAEERLWKVRHDASRNGREYYVNVATGCRVWALPQDGAPGEVNAKYAEKRRLWKQRVLDDPAEPEGEATRAEALAVASVLQTRQVLLSAQRQIDTLRQQRGAADVSPPPRLTASSPPRALPRAEVPAAPLSAVRVRPVGVSAAVLQLCSAVEEAVPAAAAEGPAAPFPAQRASPPRPSRPVAAPSLSPPRRQVAPASSPPRRAARSPDAVPDHPWARFFDPLPAAPRSVTPTGASSCVPAPAVLSVGGDGDEFVDTAFVPHRAGNNPLLARHEEPPRRASPGCASDTSYTISDFTEGDTPARQQRRRGGGGGGGGPRPTWVDDGGGEYIVAFAEPGLEAGAGTGTADPTPLNTPAPLPRSQSTATDASEESAGLMRGILQRLDQLVSVHSLSLASGAVPPAPSLCSTGTAAVSMVSEGAPAPPHDPARARCTLRMPCRQPAAVLPASRSLPAAIPWPARSTPRSAPPTPAVSAAANPLARAGWDEAAALCSPSDDGRSPRASLSTGKADTDPVARASSHTAGEVRGPNRVSGKPEPPALRRVTDAQDAGCPPREEAVATVSPRDTRARGRSAGRPGGQRGQQQQPHYRYLSPDDVNAMLQRSLSRRRKDARSASRGEGATPQRRPLSTRRGGDAAAPAADKRHRSVPRTGYATDASQGSLSGFEAPKGHPLAPRRGTPPARPRRAPTGFFPIDADENCPPHPASANRGTPQRAGKRKGCSNLLGSPQNILERRKRASSRTRGAKKAQARPFR